MKKKPVFVAVSNQKGGVGKSTVAASICYPQSDLYVPLRLTVSADGKISMAKEELLEEVYGEDAVSN
jgi:MinD superfamily P-loop ATPase